MQQTATWLLAASFLTGILIQCLSLLRKWPKKWALITFGGMLIYIGILMISSILQAPEIQLLGPLLSFGMAFGFLFIAIFLKEVLSIINEKVIFSLTVSYWFLLLYYGTNLYPASGALLIWMGVLFSAIALHLVKQKKPLIPLQKFLLYGWYLAINGIFALLYLRGLPYPFYLLHTGVASPSEMLVLGMLTIQVFYNFGILYYVFIYSLIYQGIRKQTIAQAKTLFTDQQITKKEALQIALSQAIVFIPVYFLKESFGITILAIWILLTPVLVLVFKHLHHD